MHAERSLQLGKKKSARILLRFFSGTIYIFRLNGILCISRASILNAAWRRLQQKRQQPHELLLPLNVSYVHGVFKRSYVCAPFLVVQPNRV